MTPLNHIIQSAFLRAEDDLHFVRRSDTQCISGTNNASTAALALIKQKALRDDHPIDRFFSAVSDAFDAAVDNIPHSRVVRKSHEGVEIIKIRGLAC
ncbi:MAG: hypothetical protein V4621_05175 [Pseudomonadota bacterium]